MSDETMTESNHPETPDSWTHEQLAEVGIGIWWGVDFAGDTSKSVWLLINTADKSVISHHNIIQEAEAETTRIARERQAESEPKVWWVSNEIDPEDNRARLIFVTRDPTRRDHPFIITPEGIVGETPEDEVETLAWLIDLAHQRYKPGYMIERADQMLADKQRTNAAIAAARERGVMSVEDISHRFRGIPWSEVASQQFDRAEKLQARIAELEKRLFDNGREHDVASCQLGSMCPWCRIAELEAYKADIANSIRMATDEECTSDEKHCTCVPLLREKLAERESEICNESYFLQVERERCAELEAEREALRVIVGNDEQMEERYQLLMDLWVEYETLEDKQILDPVGLETLKTWGRVLTNARKAAQAVKAEQERRDER